MVWYDDYVCTYVVDAIQTGSMVGLHCPLPTVVPTVAVSGINVERLSSSEMMVSWTSLTPREARGFPVYTITYTPTGTSGRVSRQAQSQQTQQNSTTIIDLSEGVTYSLVVGVSTAGGSGPDSTPGMWDLVIAAVVVVVMVFTSHVFIFPDITS